MTSPGRIQEILDEMQENPELARELRERILGQEFTSLSQAIA